MVSGIPQCLGPETGIKHGACEPWSKLLRRRLSSVYVGSFLKGYLVASENYTEFGPELMWSFYIRSSSSGWKVPGPQKYAK